MKQSQLTEPVVVRTNVPFVTLDVESSKAQGKPVLAKLGNETIDVEYASELVTTSVQTSLFRAQNGDTSSLDIVHDANGQPMIFSVGSDNHLYCIFHVDGTSKAWQLMDVTPSITSTTPVSVTAFDVLEVKDDLHIAVSIKFTSPESRFETHQVFWASIKQPKAEVDASGQIKGFSLEDFKWNAVVNNRGSLVITKLVCCMNPDAKTAPAFTIFAATRTTKSRTASPYAVDPNPTTQAPWTAINLGSESHGIVDMQPIVKGGASASSPKRAGLAILHDAPDAKGGTVRRCKVLTLNDDRTEAHSGYLLKNDEVGSLQGMYASYNSWKAHDVILAGNGISFHEFQNLENPVLGPKGQVILPKIAFRQVLCKETMLATPPRVILSILAVSEDDELYLIEGDRDLYNSGLPTFKYSGLPIRDNVSQIAAHYNKQQDSMEFIYTTKKDNQIFHLARDPHTSVWTSTDLQVAGPSTTSKEKQYVTTITLRNASGDPVPPDYPVSITSEPIFVKMNGLSYRLNRTRPTLVKTNEQGQIDIVTAAPKQLGVGDLQISLSQFVDRSFTVSVSLSARVTSMMSSMKTKEDLQSLTGADGKPLFQSVPQEKLEASASLLSQFNDLKNMAQASEKGSNASDTSSASSERTLVTWSPAPEPQKVEPATPKKWYEKAYDIGIEYLGDALEFLKKAVKGAVKFVVKVQGRILRFWLQYQSKILSFVVKTTVGLVRSVVGVLDNLLGTNMAEALGLQFGKHIPSIQKKLKEVTLGSLTVLDRFLVINRNSITDLFDDMEETLFGSVEKAKDPDMPRQETELERTIKRIMNSPIVKLILKYNPLQWILEGITEGVVESMSDFQLPSIRPIVEVLGITVSEFFDLGIKSFMEIIAIISSCSIDVLRDPKQMLSIVLQAVKRTFRTLFKTVRDAIMIVVDFMIRVIKTIPEMLTKAWKIPGLTNLWEDWIGQEFSIINYITYGTAIVIDMGLIGFSDEQKTKVFGIPFSEGWTQFKMEPVYKSVQRCTDQRALEAKYPGPTLPEHTNPTVMMAIVEPTNGKSTEKKPEPLEDDFDPGPFADWMSIVGGVFKLITTGTQIWEAKAATKAALDRKPPPQGEKGIEMQAFKSSVPPPQALDGEIKKSDVPGGIKVFKVVAGFVSVACMVTETVFYITSSNLAKNPANAANDVQMVGMCAGSGVALIGVMADTLFSVAEETPDTKPVACIAGTAFNLGAALTTASQPGCWTKPNWGLICQTTGSVGGAAAVITTHYYLENPIGPFVVAGAMIGDTILTGVGINSATTNLLTRKA